MKKYMFLLLKIFLILLLVFSFIASILIPILILPTILLYGSIICIWILNKKIKDLPILTESAKVISKNTSVTGSMYFVSTVHHVTFELANNTRKTLRTSAQFYGSILEGESGIVSYKEYKKFAQFIDFQRTNV